jgi:osmoprotectant transport system permease protein
MELVDAAVGWFSNPANWAGTNGVPHRLAEHLVLSIVPMLIAVAIALPIGLAIGHTGRGGLLAIAIANLGRAVPSYALLLVFLPFFGLGESSAIPALVLLAIPPILVNTYAGLRGVDRDLVEAGRGMGMTELELLRGVEIPAAAPVIIAGLRTAAVAVVATATLAALVAGGGLGRYIADGFGLQDNGLLLAGAILVALLALITERAFTFVERRMARRGRSAEAGIGPTSLAPTPMPAPRSGGLA